MTTTRTSAATAGAVDRPDDPARRRGPARALLVTARPKQWIKNGLVVVAPLAAGVLGEPDVALAVVGVTVAFCLASSGTYLLNDAADVEADRRHPVKRRRPVAAGELSVGTARVAGAVLLLASLGVAAAARPAAALVLLVYVALTTAYSTYLKHVVLVDLLAVAAGFVLRAVAGGVAASVGLSDFFLLVSCAAALFVVAGKRYSELLRAEGTAVTRASLARYTPGYLRFVWQSAATVTVVAYCLYAFGLGEADGAPLVELSAVPFVVGVLRYAFDVDAGRAEAPEQVVLTDRALQVLGVVWFGLFATAVVVA